MFRLLPDKNKVKFKPFALTDKNCELINPARGFYRIFYFVLRQETDWSYVNNNLDDTQTLVMVFINLSEANNTELNDSDMEEINLILLFFKEKGKDIILRFAYDHEGRGMEKEPGNFALVEKHAKRLVETVNRYKDNIFVLQGLLLGNWGEMHSSKYLSAEKMSVILSEYEKTDEQIYLAVRKPLQWRELYPSFAKNNDLSGIRTGIFNDGMLGSDTDLGTFGLKSKKDVGYRSEWNREEEIDFIAFLSKHFPVGGEVIDNSDILYYDCNRDINYLRKCGITYLNSEHDKNLLGKWKNTFVSSAFSKEKESVYEYVNKHLGYIFVIKKVRVKNTGNGEFLVTAKIENDGFAPVYFDTETEFEISDGEKSEKTVIKNALNIILPGESKEVSAVLKGCPGILKISAKRTCKYLR